MRALLLAAGLGTRLRPITDSIPKCLVPILGRPLLDYWLKAMFDGNIERVLINTHYFAERVAEHISLSPWRDRVDLVFEPGLQGTGGTLASNLDWFGEGPLLLAHADMLTDFSLFSLLRTHAARPPECAMTMLAFRTDDPHSCGILEVDQRGVVQAFHEKVEHPPGDLANGAVYIIEPEIAAFTLQFSPPFDLQTEVIPRFMGRIHCYHHPGYHRDVGNPEALAKAEADLKAGILNVRF